MSFARHYLRRHVPALSAAKMLMMRIRTPIILSVAAGLMMKPSAHIVAAYRIPGETLAQAYGPGSLHREYAVEALRKPRELCWELDILNDRWSSWWKRLGIWAPPSA